MSEKEISEIVSAWMPTALERVKEDRATCLFLSPLDDPNYSGKNGHYIFMSSTGVIHHWRL